MKQDSGFFFKRVIKDISDAMITYDSEFFVQKWNKAAEKMYGFTLEEVKGKQLVDVIKRTYIGVSSQQLLEEFNRDGVWQGEVYDLTKDGSQIRVLIKVSKIYDADNNVIGVVSVNRDITEQRKQQISDNRNSRIYRLLAEATAKFKTKTEFCNFIVDQLAFIMDVENVAIHLKGDDLLQQEYFCNKGADNNIITAVVKEPAVFDSIYKDGKSVFSDNLARENEKSNLLNMLLQEGYSSFHVSPIQLTASPAIGAIILLSTKSLYYGEQELTHMRNFSNMLASGVHRVISEEKLVASEQMFQSVFENIIDTYFRIEPDGTLENISTSGLTLFGYKKKNQIVGKNIAEWMFKIPETFNLFIALVEKKKLLKNYEVRAKSHNGDNIEIEINARSFFDKSGKMQYVEGIIRDITERKRMQAELCQKATLDNTVFLIGSVAHAFNNNLTAVLGSISVSQHYAGDNEKIKKFLAKAEHGCMKAKQTVQQLMLITGNIKPVCSPVDPGLLIKSVIENLEKASSVRFDLRLMPGLPEIFVNKKQISQVFTHILNNSIEAMDNTGEIIIEIGLKQEDPGDLNASNPLLEISFKDNGPGIPKEYLKQVFEPFFTLKPSCRGLGLAVSRSIIRRHEGTILTENRASGGLKVVVELPVANSCDVRIKTKSRILIMDPVNLVLQIFVELIRELGHDAFGVESVYGCLNEYRRSLEENDPYDLVFIDMGDSDSIESTELLKKLKKYNSCIRTIATSGYSDHPAVSNYQNLGFSGKLIKPFRLNKVKSEINRVLPDLI